MPKDYALRKLYSKVIICGCDAISGLLILDEPIPDKDIIKEWFFEEPERTTCWDYERTLKAVYDARITNVRIYKFCEYN